MVNLDENRLFVIFFVVEDEMFIAETVEESMAIVNRMQRVFNYDEYYILKEY